MKIDIGNNEETYDPLIHNQNYVRDELKKLNNIRGAQPYILAILGDLGEIEQYRRCLARYIHTYIYKDHKGTPTKS